MLWRLLVPSNLGDTASRETPINSPIVNQQKEETESLTRGNNNMRCQPTFPTPHNARWDQSGTRRNRSFPLYEMVSPFPARGRPVGETKARGGRQFSQADMRGTSPVQRLWSGPRNLQSYKCQIDPTVLASNTLRLASPTQLSRRTKDRSIICFSIT